MNIHLRPPTCLIVHLLLMIANGHSGSLFAAEENTGAIEARVTYQYDSKRPWRYGRFYIKDRKLGHLAEAVVSLRSPKLKGGKRPAKPRTLAIDQKDHQFVPETTVIRAGDQVRFTNGDREVHNVNSQHPYNTFDATTPPSREFKYTFGRATGIRRPVVIGCRYHGSMRAWVYVFEHPYYALTGKDGLARITDVPPGEYDLQMRHPAGDLRWEEKVTVRAGETIKVDIPVSPNNVGR